MSGDRIDALLHETLARGAIPSEVTAEEHAELESLLRAIEHLRISGRVAEDEARRSMPLVRARFQRYVASQAPAVAPPAVRSGGREGLRGLLSGSRLHGVAASVAGLAALVVVALLLSHFAFGPADSAYAQVVQPGDYVQVEGVVDQARGSVLKLSSSELGPLEVTVTENTSFVDSSGAVDSSRLNPGDRVLVAGIAGKERTLEAQTLALGQAHEGPHPRMMAFHRLQRLGEDLAGQVVTFTISSDGTRGAVLIDAGDGQRYLVRIDGQAAEDLLGRAPTALGQQVTIIPGAESTAGRFSLGVPSASPAQQERGPGPNERHGHPALATARGVISSVEGAATDREHAGAALLTVRTSEGSVTVLVRPQTRVFIGQSGLEGDAPLGPAAAGHAVSVAGGFDSQSGNLVADVIVLGRAPGR